MSTVATYIEIRRNRADRPRAYIEGTRVRVQDVALMAEWQGSTPDEIVNALPHLSLGKVHAALSYFFDHRDDIMREVKEDAEFVKELQSQQPPSPLKARMAALMATQAGDAVSP